VCGLLVGSSRIWRTFKLSNDRRFDEKLIDVIGVYLNPPDKAVVLCMDEKSQIQALDRKSVPDLIAAIEAYLQANNNDPKPFVWTATAEEILEKVSRGRVALASIPANNETPH